jgi:hypothetical protein
MKRLLGALAGLLSISAYLVLAGVPAFGDDEGSVTTTVTVQTPPPCITVGISSFNYGTLGFRPLAPSDSVTGDTGEFDITNCGSEPADILASSTDFESTTTADAWTLRNSASCPTSGTPLNQVMHQYSRGITNFPLITSNQEVVSNLASSGVQAGRLILFMPCEGSSGFGQTFEASVTFTATAVTP